MPHRKVRISYVYCPKPISYAKYTLLENNVYFVRQWYRCRDLWQVKMGKPDVFFLAHKNGKSKNIIEFMKQVENILNLEQKSEYGLTQKKFIIYIKPSKWWLDKAIKKSLFTLLLRCGSIYNKNNFQQALISEEYLEKTKESVDRFLSGHTNYNGKVRGWYNQFFIRNPSSEQIKCLLTK